MSRTALLALLFAFTACASEDVARADLGSPAATAVGGAPTFPGMGRYRFDVTTDSAAARRYFDQGLALCHGFNHDEAARSFGAAQQLDPGFAMAYWGEAYALGPNFNLWDEGEAYATRASKALERARELAPSASPLERELIHALSQRFALPRPADRTALNQAYAEAMREVWSRHQNHVEVGFLAADALLMLHPWDQWTLEGEPKWETLEVVGILERVLSLDVNHPGANHLYIHTMEGSQEAQRAEAAADRLGALMPGVGHMVHMPAHIYMRLGRYDDSTRVNAAAVELDRGYFAATGQQESTGIYHAYHLHNHHFLIWSAMFQGRYEDALEQCDEMLADLPQALRSDVNFADFFATRLHVLVRFGRWQRILATASPPADQPYAVAIWHYARGIALANTGRIEEARQEQAGFEKEAAKVPPEQHIHVVQAQKVVEVARKMLAGEIAFKAGQIEPAFVELRAAVAAENALRYTEPNPWMMPTRHALAALLLQEGQVEEAERHYRDDLKRYPGNGWSLHGLAECLERRGATDEAAAVKASFQKAWSKATIEIPGSCFCRTG